MRGEKDENVLTPGADEGGEGFRGVIGDPGSGPGSVVTAAGVFKAKKVASEMVQCIWFKSKVVSRGHAEMWCKDGQVSAKFGMLLGCAEELDLEQFPVELYEKLTTLYLEYRCT